MTEDRWKDVLERVKSMFEVLEEGNGELEDRPGTREFIQFMGPGDKTMQLEYLSYPPVTGKKTLGSRRIGGETVVEYQYSDSDVINRMVASTWNSASEEWEEMKGESNPFET